jgi:hypothetical protein
MKKLAIIFGIGLGLTSCGNAFCDCDMYTDSYTWDGFAYQLNNSALTASDTCLDAGVIDSTTSGAGAYLSVRRVQCP